jgi:prephenate dehydrogenase/chorismate mutase/prephenate dehydrogenase
MSNDPHKLKKIDIELIELLGKRIAVLAESEPPSLEEQFSNTTPLLASAGVPDVIWKHLITGVLPLLLHPHLQVMSSRDGLP